MGKKGRKQNFSLSAKEERARDERVAEDAKTLRAKIIEAHKNIQDICDRDRKRTGVQRSRLQLLVRFRLELRPFDAMVAILQVEANLKRDVERHQESRRLQEDLIFAQQQKSLLLEKHPKLTEQMETEDCPNSRF